MTEGQITNYLLARLIGLKEGEGAETILAQARDYYNHNKEEKEKEDKFNFKQALVEYGVDKDLARDFLQIRKAKKAINTESAFNLLMAECDKSQLLLKDAVRFAVERNWSAFKSDWYYNAMHPVQTEQTTPQPQMTSEFTKKKEEFQ